MIEDNVKVGDRVYHSAITTLKAVVWKESSNDQKYWVVKYFKGTSGNLVGRTGTWLKVYTKKYVPAVAPPAVAPPSINPCSEIPLPGAITASDLMKAYDRIKQPTEENNMRFIRVQKQLLVDGVDIFTMDEQQLLDHIEAYQIRIKELHDMDFESTRMEKESDKLCKMVKRLIKLLDAMD